jgi:hypothetical protein
MSSPSPDKLDDQDYLGSDEPESGFGFGPTLTAVLIAAVLASGLVMLGIGLMHQS